MLYELRTYSAMPGRLPDLHKRFAEITLGYFKKHGIQVVGFWTNELGGASDQLIYMLAYDSSAIAMAVVAFAIQTVIFYFIGLY